MTPLLPPAATILLWAMIVALVVGLAVSASQRLDRRVASRTTGRRLDGVSRLEHRPARPGAVSTRGRDARP